MLFLIMLTSIQLNEANCMNKQKASQSSQALSLCRYVHISVCIQTDTLLIMFNTVNLNMTKNNEQLC